MLSEEYEKKLDEEYRLLNSKESIEYTRRVLLEMGKYIQQNFRGVEFELKARFKSKTSFKGKKDRIRKSEKPEKPIYDVIGFCLIVKSVSDNFNFQHILCKKLVDERITIGNTIDNEILSLQEMEESFRCELNKITEKLKRLSCYPKNGEVVENHKLTNEEELDRLLKTFEYLKDAYKLNDDIQILLDINQSLINKLKQQQDEIEEKMEKLEKTLKKQYEDKDDEINKMIATHIMNNLMGSEIFMNKLQLEKIPGRTKIHDGGKSGFYIAFHDNLSGKVIKYWKVDLHAMSDRNYRVSQKDHSQAEGKKRIFPRINSTNFKNEVLSRVPRNLVYQCGKYEETDEGTLIETEPGKVYECSDIENRVYFYLEILRENRATFKSIISDCELFSGSGISIESSGDEINEKSVREDDLEL